MLAQGVQQGRPGIQRQAMFLAVHAQRHLDHGGLRAGGGGSLGEGRRRKAGGAKRRAGAHDLAPGRMVVGEVRLDRKGLGHGLLGSEACERRTRPDR